MLTGDNADSLLETASVSSAGGHSHQSCDSHLSSNSHQVADLYEKFKQREGENHEILLEEELEEEIRNDVSISRYYTKDKVDDSILLTDLKHSSRKDPSTKLPRGIKSFKGSSEARVVGEGVEKQHDVPRLVCRTPETQMETKDRKKVHI